MPTAVEGHGRHGSTRPNGSRGGILGHLAPLHKCTAESRRGAGKTRYAAGVRYWKYYVLPAIAALLFLAWAMLRPKDEPDAIGPPPEPVAPEMYDRDDAQAPEQPSTGTAPRKAEAPDEPR